MSKLEVDKIDPQSGTDLELGSSGDTITIPTGVTLDASNATTTLPANVVTTDGTQTLTNKTIDASQLSGTITPSDGTVTNAKVNASAAIDYSKLNLTGNIALADLSATGTKDATTFLRGDNTFAEPGGGSWILLNTQTVTGTPSSVESGAVFSSTYDTYVIVIRRINFTANGGFYMYLGTSGSYTTSGYKRTGSGVRDGTSLLTGGGNEPEISLLGGTGTSYHVNTTQDCLGGVIWVHNPYNSNRTSIHAELSWENATDLAAHINNIGAHPNTNTSYDRWKLAPSTRNFEATTIIQTFGVINA